MTHLKLFQRKKTFPYHWGYMVFVNKIDQYYNNLILLKINKRKQLHWNKKEYLKQTKMN